MDAMSYPKPSSPISVFKINTQMNESQSSINKRSRFKLNPIEAQKLNSELIKFNYSTKEKKEKKSNEDLQLNKDKSKSNDKLFNKQKHPNEYLLPKLDSYRSSKEWNEKFKQNKPDFGINSNSTYYNSSSFLVDLNRQSMEINPVINNDSNKRYFYKYLLGKKGNSSYMSLSSNSSTKLNEANPLMSSSTTNPQSISIQKEASSEILDQVKSYRQGSIDMIEGSKITFRNEDGSGTSRKTTQKDSSRPSQYKIKEEESQSGSAETFHTQFRLKPLQLTKNNATNIVDDMDESVLNLKLEKKSRNEKSPARLRPRQHNESAPSPSAGTTAYLSITNSLPLSVSSGSPNTTSSSNSRVRLTKLSKNELRSKPTSSYTNLKNSSSYSNLNEAASSNTGSSSGSQTGSQSPKIITSKFNTNYSSYLDEFEFTRVESPHKLGKSNDEYKFVSYTSMNVNLNSKTRFNQQFELFQSQYYDKPDLLI